MPSSPRRVHLWLLLLGLIGAAVLPAIARGQDVAVPPWRVDLPGPPPRATITVGEESLRVEVVRESEDVALGLGYRNGLEPGTGMLFVFPFASEQSFWMKGMRFCLDIVWIADEAIVGAAERACPDPPGTADNDRPSYLSPVPVSHVLEVPAGWLDEHGLGAGTPVDLSAVPTPSGF